MLNFFFSNIKPTFVQEETINEGFVFITKAFVFINETCVCKNESSVYSSYLTQKYLSIREKEVLP